MIAAVLARPGGDGRWARSVRAGSYRWLRWKRLWAGPGFRVHTERRPSGANYDKNRQALADLAWVGA